MHPAHDFDRPHGVWPPDPVTAVTALHLDLVDEVAPGLVEGLYLHGSLVFGEWHDGISDVDFAALSSRRPTEPELGRLRDAHAALSEQVPGLAFDGFYATWNDLAVPPAEVPDVPCTLAGTWHDEGRVSVNPVTWHEIAHQGISVRGPQPDDLTIWTDQKALRAFTHDNLVHYWGENVPKLAQFPQEAATPDAVAWFVLGTSRLHHLLARDELTTKDGAGRYAREAFGERWAYLADEALTARATGALTKDYDSASLGADVAEFCTMVVRTGLEIPV